MKQTSISFSDSVCLLGGSWVVIGEVIRTLIWIITMVTPLIAKDIGVVFKPLGFVAYSSTPAATVLLSHTSLRNLKLPRTTSRNRDFLIDVLHNPSEPCRGLLGRFSLWSVGIQPTPELSMITYRTNLYETVPLHSHQISGGILRLYPKPEHHKNR